MLLDLVFITALKVVFCENSILHQNVYCLIIFPHYHFNPASLLFGLAKSKAFTLAVPCAWDTLTPEISTCLISHHLHGFVRISPSQWGLTWNFCLYMLHKAFVIPLTLFYYFITHHFLMDSIIYLFITYIIYCLSFLFNLHVFQGPEILSAISYGLNVFRYLDCKQILDIQ